MSMSPQGQEDECIKSCTLREMCNIDMVGRCRLTPG